MPTFLLGYHCQEHNNPPDFFLDVINGDPNATSNDLQQILATTGKKLCLCLYHFLKKVLFSTCGNKFKQLINCMVFNIVFNSISVI